MKNLYNSCRYWLVFSCTTCFAGAVQKCDRICRLGVTILMSISILVCTKCLGCAKDVGATTFPLTTVTVFDVSIAVPNTVVNKSVYEGSTGEATASLEASVIPDAAASRVEELTRWAFDDIPSGSELTWFPPWPEQPTAGKGLKPGFVLKNYPDDNREFGVRKLMLDVIRAGGALISKSENVKFFYDKYKIASGRLTPNWYFYWWQTSARIGNPYYDPLLPQPGKYNPQTPSYFLIGNPACELNPETGHDGIDNFAETCIHENTHLMDWHGFWLNGYQAIYDLDGDQIPDHMELELSTPEEPLDPTKFDTDGDGLYDFRDYSEPRGYASEKTWRVGDADGEDWAAPGHQY